MATYKSLRESTIESIGNFLHEEGFVADPYTKEGIVEILNLVSDYKEEGKSLYPEIIITNNEDLFKGIPEKRVQIKASVLSIKEFKNAIKLCAPLAVNGWIIYIIVKDGYISYGMITAEMSETTISIYEQTVGKLKSKFRGICVAYIRNIGDKLVQITGLKKKIVISLTLENLKLNKDFPRELSIVLSTQAKKESQVLLQEYLEKKLGQALKEGHGNLIGIINDNAESINNVKATYPDGIYLTETIDFQKLVLDTQNKIKDADANLRHYGFLLKAMINHDGITIMTNTGKLIGYHVFIKVAPSLNVDHGGGARTRAFEEMKKSKIFVACFFKSQDGHTNLDIKKIKNE